MILLSCNTDPSSPERFGFGKPADSSIIKAWDTDVRPDGKGLPPGQGNLSAGRMVYQQKCAVCHGATGKEGPYQVLIGATGDTTRAKTIGNYWPYATTVFDYIKRAMPYNQPNSLTDDEVYALTSFLLFENKVTRDTVQDQHSLPLVEMPSRLRFVPDDRKGGKEIR